MVTPRTGDLPRWLVRDWIAGGALFVATAAVVLWQNAHVAVLWDLSYVLDSAARIAAGQVPYRQFPFAHSPLTFLLQAAMIRLTGRVYFHHVVYVALIGGLGTVITWRIALRALRGRVVAAWPVALLTVAPLSVLGIYCILPNPEYDCDCAFWILVAVWLLQRLDVRQKSVMNGLVAGALACLPLFFKQNMGLPFLVAVAAAIAALIAFRTVRPSADIRNDKQIRAHLGAVIGIAAALSAAVLVLHWTCGLRHYIHWTILFAAQRRMPAWREMLSVYRERSLLWALPCVVTALIFLRTWIGRQKWGRLVAFLLLAAPFLFMLSSLLLYDDADERGDALLAIWPLLLILASVLALRNLFRLRRDPDMRTLLPLILLVAINGTMMSQQLWGSSYAVWPLLILLVAEMLAFLESIAANSGVAHRLTPVLAALIAVTFLICGGFYTASEERLSYAKFPDTPVQHSAFPQLAGMATPGPYLPEFDELLRYANTNIPINDGLILLPGEDPFYFATGRVPRFPVLLFDPTTNPYTPGQIASLAGTLNIRWLIVKRDLQLVADPMPAGAATLQALLPRFTLAAHLHGYDVYRR